MGFILILLATTLSIAGAAAFFSIYGLAQIFAGSFWPVVVMASSLEAGKLVSASYVYRFWKDISFLMKTYLISAILVLMLITSAGIFGFLSAAYQTDTLPLKEMESKIVLYGERKVEIGELKAERIEQRNRLDAQIDAIPGNHSTNRRKMRESQIEERSQIDTDLKQFAAELLQVSKDRSDLQGSKIQQEAHIGPIIYIAKVFERSTDDATMWMILLIIFAFDPLAVVLTIATNMAIIKRKELKIASGEITDFVEIKEVHDQAHDMYDSGALNRNSLQEFDELTDIVEDFEEPEPLTDEDKEWLNAPPVGKEFGAEPESIDVLTKEIEKVAIEQVAVLPEEVPEEHIEHAENTLKTLKKTAQRRKLTKEEETLKRLLHHMVLHKMPIPNIKGGDNEHFITGESR